MFVVLADDGCDSDEEEELIDGEDRRLIGKALLIL